MDKHLRDILDQLYAEGYKPGTPQFAFILRKRKVERCKELRNVSSCQVCSYFDSCDLVKAYMRDLAEIKQRQHARMVEEKKIREAHAKGAAIPGGMGATQVGGLPEWQVTPGMGEASDPGLYQPWGEEEAVTGITRQGGHGSGIPAPGPAGQPASDGSHDVGGGTGSSESTPDPED
jgi:hypothetical protein